MDKEKIRQIKELSFFSSVGLTLALSIFIGLFVGYWLDRHFDTRPWLTLIFLGLGIAAGYRNIGMAIKRIRKF